jgi:ribosomal protein S18 acetylase RimI-like enzyme
LKTDAGTWLFNDPMIQSLNDSIPMSTFNHDPPLPPSFPRDTHTGFAQSITLHEADQPLALARWHAPSGEQGVVQLVELTVDPAHRRRGLGSALLREVIQQATALHQLKHFRLRRLWISVEQKTQVIARAFLTQHGFHHTATIKELLDHQDAMVYVRTFD